MGKNTDYTKPISNQLPLDLIEDLLVEQALVKNKNEELKAFQYSNGYSNLTYLLQYGDHEFVLRCPPAGAVKRGHDMSREYKVLTALSKHFDWAPKPYYYSDANGLLDRSFYLMEKINGVILSSEEARKRNIRPEEYSTISKSWMDRFVDLHQLDFDSIGLTELGKAEGYVSRQVNIWSKQYLKAATMDIPNAEKLMRWMDENRPTQYDHSFIHNDYKYDNVVYEEGNWTRVKAVLDWEMCTLGDPLMDLGTSLAYWMRPEDGPATRLFHSPTIMEGNPTRSEIVEMYANRTGRNVDHIVFYYAYGLFKIAVIVQQIFYRYHKGLTKNEKFSKLDKACELFINMAWVAINKNKIENYL